MKEKGAGRPGSGRPQNGGNGREKRLNFSMGHDYPTHPALIVGEQ